MFIELCIKDEFLSKERTLFLNGRQSTYVAVTPLVLRVSMGDVVRLPSLYLCNKKSFIKNILQHQSEIVINFFTDRIQVVYRFV